MKKSLMSMIVILCFGAALHAQGTGTIDGTVIDSTHAAVPRASVTLTEVQTGLKRTTASSQEGYFTFTNLGPGTYTLKVSLAGFKAWQQQNIILSVAQHASLHPMLQVGNVTQTVQVTSVSPLVTTSSSTVSSVVGSRQIEELPLNGRNALQLVSLTPGAISTGSQGQFGATEPSFAISGGRDIDVNWFLDGASNINPFYADSINFPDPDALQEFSVLSRDYSAEYGRGSTIVSAVTRSGTNKFHGSAFEFVRNMVLDSRPFFSANRPVYKRNQFGGTLGGPIRRNKAFFFVSYQGTQVRGAPGSTAYTTMTAAERTGDFSALSKPVIDPTTGQPFPGNIIPPNRITPQATKFINDFLPAANLGQDAYTFTPATKLSENQVIGKIDYQFTPRDTLSARYLFDNLPQSSSSSLTSEFAVSFPTRYQSASLDYTHTFSPTLLNDANLSYVRSAFGVSYLPPIFSLAALGYPVSASNAISNLSSQSVLSVAGYFREFLNSGTRDTMPMWYFHDDVAWVHNMHSIHVGMELYHNRVNELQNYLTGGALSFSGQFTGNAAADFLLGNFSSYQQIGGFASRLHQMLPSIYVQDDIKLSHRVTLTAGLRWDPVAGYRSEDKQLSTILPGIQSTLFPLAPKGLLYPGDNGLPDNIVGTRWNNFGPRLGVAWDVFGNGKTSIRAGAGIYYVPFTQGIGLNGFALIAPFTPNITVFGGNTSNLWAAPPYNGVDPFPFPTAGNLAGLKALPFPPFAGESSLALPFKTQADNQWSFSVQQQLWRNAVLEVDYVGSSSSHLTTYFNSNPAVYIPGASTVANTQSRRIYPQIGAVNTIDEIENSNYNALQISFRQRYSHGLSLNSNYTYSKALGVVACEGAGCSNINGSNGPRDPNNFGLDYGPLSYDIGQSWVTDFLWRPAEHRKFSNRLVGAVAGGWGLTSILTIQSGPPLSLSSGVDHSFTGIGGDTPNQVGPWQLPGGRSKGQQIQEWFNPNAFVTNPVGTFGTLGMGALRSPGYWNWDTAVLRTFVPREGYTLEFRGSFYNILNHANLGAPVNNLTSPAFGRIQGATGPREIEFSLRLSF